MANQIKIIVYMFDRNKGKGEVRKDKEAINRHRTLNILIIS